MALRAERLFGGPIIHAGLDESIGTNINGPSLVRAPSWLDRPLGRYYLYFAAHGGTFIRLALADELGGPWTIYRPGTLRLEQTVAHGHIASPDVHVDEEAREVRMYFHGPMAGGQMTFLARSPDGVAFTADSAVLGPSYFRVFEHGGAHYALAMSNRGAGGGGVILRSADGRTPFERGPEILPRQRHVAVQKRGDRLRIFLSRGLDCPERIMVSDMSLAGDWRSWRADEPRSLIEPQTAYEGGDLPLEASQFGLARTRVRQVRDPAVFEEDGQTYLVYSCAGESALAVARIVDEH